jgi:cell division protein FtsZ
VKTTPASVQPQNQVEEEPAASERPRFGIGSLINRMSGAESDRSRVAKAPAAPQETPVLAAEATEPPLEQERIEVPAFLRRQAN